MKTVLYELMTANWWESFPYFSEIDQEFPEVFQEILVPDYLVCLWLML